MKFKSIAILCVLTLTACGKSNNPKVQADRIQETNEKIEAKLPQTEVIGEEVATEDKATTGAAATEEKATQPAESTESKRACTEDDSLAALSAMNEMTVSFEKMEQSSSDALAAITAGDQEKALSKITEAEAISSRELARCESIGAGIDVENCAITVTAQAFDKLAETCEQLEGTDAKLTELKQKLAK